MLSAGLIEKVISELRLEEGEGRSSAAIWGKSILHRGYKGPEAGAGLAV